MNASLEKRLDKILTDERTHNGIYTNPNVTMTNLSSRTLTNDEHEVLKYGLKHGIATKPNENDISALAEDIYDIEKTLQRKPNICTTLKKQPTSLFI